MNPYLQMFRMGNAVMGAVGLLVACFMAAGTDAFASEYLVNMALCAAVVVVFVAGGNSINDSIDYEIDKTSHPERPVPMGRITPKQAHVTGISLLLLSVIISIFTFDAACIAIVVIASVLMYLYEVLLKQRGFIGNITIAVLTGMVFLLGSAIVHDVWANLAPALMAGLVTVGREICKDIEDMEGDEGRNTLPMMIGKRNAAIVAVLFFISGPILSIWPMVVGMYGPLYYSVFIADAFFVYAAYLGLKDPHAGQSTAKKGMMFGLLAFILGAIKF
jgi:geranylgeranylglycerol-phosphate geranylgeranyltransferase